MAGIKRKVACIVLGRRVVINGEIYVADEYILMATGDKYVGFTSEKGEKIKISEDDYVELA